MEATMLQDETLSAEEPVTQDSQDWRTPIANNRVVPSSILALLDDKNRAITILKQQVENQKLQLGFYLHRELSNPKITELSETCADDEVEENIQVNLAMNKFCKESGLASRIMWLHQRMKEVEGRTANLLDQQEEMVKQIITKLQEFSHNGGKEEGVMEYVLLNLKDKSTAVNILGKIANHTNKLRKELDTFRTCCGRLVAVEDERNSLVEQVYSMPVTQRMSYGVLLAAQYEKLRLEKEVREIRRDQRMLQQRLATISQPNSSHESGRCIIGTSGDQTDLQKMLNSVNAEAISLLAMAKSQRDKYLEEISKLKEANDDLFRQVARLQDEVRQNEILEPKVEEIMREHEMFKEQSRNKLNELYVKLQGLVDENSDLKKRLEQFYDIEEQVKFLRTQIDEMDGIRRQRDYFKSQVDDLQAIRTAYSQLVEQPLATRRDQELDNRTIREQDRKIAEMEHQQERMGTEIRSLEDIVSDQELQIKHLLTIIYKLVQYKEPPKDKIWSSCAITDTHGQLAINNQDNIRNTKNCIKSPSDKSNEYSHTEPGSSFNTSPRATPLFATPLSSFHKVFADKTTTCALIGDENTTVTHDQRDVRPLFKVEGSKSIGSLKESSKNCNEKNATQTPLNVTPLVSTTSVQVQTTNRQGKSESMKAVLQSSSPIDGLIQMNNSRALTLRLTCGQNSDSNKGTEGILVNISGQEFPNKLKGSVDYSAPDLDEFELMKDSSKETVVATLPSVHNQIEDLVQLQHVEITSSTHLISNTHLAMQSSIGILHKATDDAKFAVSRESIFRPTGSECSDSEFENLNTVIENDRALAKPYERALVKRGERSLIPKYDTMNISSRLQQITCYLDQTLSMPGGRDVMFNSVKSLYDTLFHEINKTMKNHSTISNVSHY